MDVFTRLRGKLPEADVPFHHLTTSAVSWTDRWILLLVLSAGFFSYLLGWPGLALGLLLPVGLWFFQAFRIGWGVRRRAASFSDAMDYGLFTMLGKWAQRIGQRRYLRDVKAGKIIKIIEYK